MLGGFFPNTAQLGGAGGGAHVSISKEEKPAVGKTHFLELLLNCNYLFVQKEHFTGIQHPGTEVEGALVLSAATILPAGTCFPGEEGVSSCTLLCPPPGEGQRPPPLSPVHPGGL